MQSEAIKNIKRVYDNEECSGRPFASRNPEIIE